MQLEDASIAKKGALSGFSAADHIEVASEEMLQLVLRGATTQGQVDPNKAKRANGATTPAAVRPIRTLVLGRVERLRSLDHPRLDQLRVIKLMHTPTGDGAEWLRNLTPLAHLHVLRLDRLPKAIGQLLHQLKRLDTLELQRVTNRETIDQAHEVLPATLTDLTIREAEASPTLVQLITPCAHLRRFTLFLSMSDQDRHMGSVVSPGVTNVLRQVAEWTELEEFACQANVIIHAHMVDRLLATNRSHLQLYTLEGALVRDRVHSFQMRRDTTLALLPSLEHDGSAAAATMGYASLEPTSTLLLTQAHFPAFLTSPLLVKLGLEYASRMPNHARAMVQALNHAATTARLREVYLYGQPLWDGSPPSLLWSAMARQHQLRVLVLDVQQVDNSSRVDYDQGLSALSQCRELTSLRISAAHATFSLVAVRLFASLPALLTIDLRCHSVPVDASALGVWAESRSLSVVKVSRSFVVDLDQVVVPGGVRTWQVRRARGQPTVLVDDQAKRDDAAVDLDDSKNRPTADPSGEGTLEPSKPRCTIL